LLLQEAELYFAVIPTGRGNAIQILRLDRFGCEFNLVY
jgi:hypothetical protein